MFYLTLLVFCAIVRANAVDIQTTREKFLADKELALARDQCLSELKMTAEELAQELKEETAGKISEKVACLIKCVHEKRGNIDEKKMLVIDRLEKLELFSHVAEDKKSEVLECLGNLGAIEECLDVEGMRQCFKKVLD